MGKISVLLADDHAVFRDGLKMLLGEQANIEVVGEAGDGATAFQMALELKPNVIVMDISMPGWNGIKATEELKKVFPDIKVLVLTAHDDTAYLRRLRQAGAQGYMLKSGASSELIQAIRVVAEGGVYLEPVLAGKVFDHYARNSPSEKANAQKRLSGRETEVLRLIAWGYSNKEIAARLNISYKTVETHKTRLMDKLNLRSRADIVRYSMHQGWMEEL